MVHPVQPDCHYSYNISLANPSEAVLINHSYWRIRTKSLPQTVIRWVGSNLWDDSEVHLHRSIHHFPLDHTKLSPPAFLRRSSARFGNRRMSQASRTERDYNPHMVHIHANQSSPDVPIRAPAHSLHALLQFCIPRWFSICRSLAN